jgi:hypothetical protein
VSAAPPRAPKGDAPATIDSDGVAPAAQRGLVNLETVPPVPPEVPVGTGLAFQARVSSAAGSDLRGGSVNVVTADKVVSRVLEEYRDGLNVTGDFTLTPPEQLGEVTWILQFPGQEIDGIAYEETSLPVSFKTVPHRTSLAAWDIPSPVLIGDRFTMKVGAKSSGACNLKGAKVEIRDETGATIGHGTIGDTPWPETSALFWCEVALAAPPNEGLFSWSAAFAAGDLTLPHVDSSTTFSFIAVKRPEHRLTVKIIDGDSAAAMADVDVALGPYRAASDGAGLAHIDTPAGHYNLAVWKPGFEAAPLTIEITADTVVQIALKRLPEDVKLWG